MCVRGCRYGLAMMRMQVWFGGDGMALWTVLCVVMHGLVAVLDDRQSAQVCVVTWTSSDMMSVRRGHKLVSMGLVAIHWRWHRIYDGGCGVVDVVAK